MRHTLLIYTSSPSIILQLVLLTRSFLRPNPSIRFSLLQPTFNKRFHIDASFFSHVLTARNSVGQRITGVPIGISSRIIQDSRWCFVGRIVHESDAVDGKRGGTNTSTIIVVITAICS